MPAVNGKKKYSSVCSSEILSLGTKCWKLLLIIFWNFIIMKLPTDMKTRSIKPRSFVLLTGQFWPQVDLKSDQILHYLWDILFPLIEKKILLFYLWGLKTKYLKWDLSYWWALNTWQLWLGFPGGSDGEESACNAGDLGLIPLLGRSPGEGNGYPLQYSCHKSHRQKSLMSYSPWGHKELDINAWLTHTCSTYDY